MTHLRVRYQTVEFDNIDIHLCTLRDTQEFYDPYGIAESLGISSASWPLFGIVWPSGLVLAKYMFDYDTGTKRILEVGCGMALSSLLLNKLHADITATDRHPDAERFLQRNTRLNDERPISFKRVDWDDSNDDLGRFDVIIGSDLLYEDEHIALLADFINAHACPTCEVILVDPGRGRKSKMASRMLEHGFTSTEHKPQNTDYLEHVFKGYILTFERRQSRGLKGEDSDPD